MIRNSKFTLEMDSIKKLVRKNILAMTAYASARSEFTGVAEVFLDANENPFDNGLNRYPDPLQKTLKAKIASEKQVNSEQIFLGNGSDEAIDLLIRIFCEPGKDEIITLPPTYGMYKVSAALSDIKIVTIPLTSDFKIETKAVLRQVSERSKILFICSPNNPTGNDIPLEQIKDLLNNFEGIVVVDEAYIDFSQQDSCTRLLEKYPRLITLQTFSKAWGLAGIRLGMAFAHPAIIQLLNKVKPPYNINQLTQSAALKALDNSNEKKANVQSILQQRDFLTQAFSSIGFIKKVYPSDANFLLVKMEEPKAVYSFLLANHVIVRDRSNVTGCAGCLRFTIGTPAENERLIALLKKFKTDSPV